MGSILAKDKKAILHVRPLCSLFAALLHWLLRVFFFFTRRIRAAADVVRQQTVNTGSFSRMRPLVLTEKSIPSFGLYDRPAEQYAEWPL